MLLILKVNDQKIILRMEDLPSVESIKKKIKRDTGFDIGGMRLFNDSDHKEIKKETDLHIAVASSRTANQNLVLRAEEDKTIEGFVTLEEPKEEKTGMANQFEMIEYCPEVIDSEKTSLIEENKELRSQCLKQQEEIERLKEFILQMDKRKERHIGIKCDNCSQMPIRGIRYMCLSCEDFDLCELCERENNHSCVMLKIQKHTTDTELRTIIDKFKSKQND